MQHRELAVALTFILLAAVGSVAGQTIPLGDARTGMAVEQNPAGEERLVVTVSEVRLRGIEIEGQSWAAVRMPDCRNLMRRGHPSVPYLTGRYLLEATGGIDLELVSVETLDVDLGEYGYAGVAPSKGHFDRDIDPDTVPWIFDESIYGGERRYPTAAAQVGTPYIAGPVRAQSVGVNTAFWHPAENVLTVLVRAELRIVHRTHDANERQRASRPMTGLFAGLVDSAVNAHSGTERYDPLVETGNLLIITYDEFLEEVQPLADWHELVGYPTTVTPVSSVGSTASEIMDYIQDFYVSPGLTWIILVGDYQHIPNFNGVHSQSSPCDPCYTKLEGDDNRPDAAISRISAQTEDEVTVQVDKILDYEQSPDTGAAAEWYTKGFGIGGDDQGGTSLADWERVELLRKDLVTLAVDPEEPHYTYTEFDQLYHSPSSTAVGDAVDDGRGLGLYIGHGAETYWVTSGFSVTDVHNLTNGGMLPVVWDVACVNGAFHSVNECFAEAWLRHDTGGAVSFEAGTTNESWVEPCIGQRGFVDAFRLEEAFTTGGQHVNGKLYLMDNPQGGEGDSSEGNKFMEQSTLFGSCLLWPRAEEPQTPDEPDDFIVSGGQASLTVTVDGAPYERANGAIVSFYEPTSRGITVLGSGLIDATGVVSAPVSGEPTHCHIHGRDLIPVSYELAATADGRVTLDEPAYACDGTVGVRVGDSNVPGSSDATIDTVSLNLATAAGDTDITLTETGAATNFYEGTYTLGSVFPVADGQTLTATYIDADDGQDGYNIPKTDTADIDCAGPVISGVWAKGNTSTGGVRFTTDEPGTTVVVWGPTKPPTQTLSDTTLVTDHVVSVSGLSDCTRYWFFLESEDALGNLTVDDNGGAYYFFDTADPTVVQLFSEPMDADPGWSIDNGTTADGWAFGTPQATGADGDDPPSGADGPYVYGYNITTNNDGDYQDGIPAYTLTTTPFDISMVTPTVLRFQRWLGVEYATYDHAKVEMSSDGGSWTVLWENQTGYQNTIDESSWSEQSITLPDLAAATTMRLRWVMGPTDGYVNYCGWNIDNVVIEGVEPCQTCTEPPAWTSGDGLTGLTTVTEGSCGLSGFVAEWSEAESTCAQHVRYRVWVQKAADVDFGLDPTFEGIDATSFTVMGVTPGTTYAVAVRAYDEYGNEDANTTDDTIVPSGARSGDVNGDTLVDGADIDALVGSLFQVTKTPDLYDVDCSGSVDAGDLAAEIVYLSNGLY